jgi:ligand-binding SRPBCC domain-containing protein
LHAPAEEVWRHATSPLGINRELAPRVRMTFPAHVTELTPEEVRMGEPITTSWILLYGWLPIDRARITLLELEPMRFVEQSPLATMRLWRHERSIHELDDGCELVDVLTFEPRLPAFEPLAERLIRWIFTHRHARLKALFR